ncbi:hypothetical protein GQ43DRAFT_147842 [Delitschia confertaspora ATCC 74209]|uniref:Uncharacterized protein n=1 Tax=Delitschia confertaspora ATCC 74209 TaxID=1513339 RepID=A0A9P4JFZ8_9PLEO|nr:hypothetical protein GQ43DRAFT_147842 [Delitschia confertaspora ATCC 74209]
MVSPVWGSILLRVIVELRWVHRATLQGHRTTLQGYRATGLQSSLIKTIIDYIKAYGLNVSLFHCTAILLISHHVSIITPLFVNHTYHHYYCSCQTIIHSLRHVRRVLLSLKDAAVALPTLSVSDAFASLTAHLNRDTGSFCQHIAFFSPSADCAVCWESILGLQRTVLEETILSTCIFQNSEVSDA